MDDRRVHIYYENALKFIRKCEDEYDLIIVDSSDPFGPSEGLFTREFYGSCFNALRADGIMVNQQGSPFYAEDATAMQRSHQRIACTFPISKVYQAHIPTFAAGTGCSALPAKNIIPSTICKSGYLRTAARTAPNVTRCSPPSSSGSFPSRRISAARDTDMNKFDFTGLTELTDWLCQTDVPVYLTIDLDCLDPSAFPGTGTPEAGGVSFLQLLGAIRTVTKANIIGADVNELAPMLDQSGVSTATACKVLRELLLALEK